MCSASNLSNHALQAAPQLLSFIHAGKQETFLAETSAELDLLKQNLGFSRLVRGQSDDLPALSMGLAGLEWWTIRAASN